jgi:hypothetical protein
MQVHAESALFQHTAYKAHRPKRLKSHSETPAKLLHLAHTLSLNPKGTKQVAAIWSIVTTTSTISSQAAAE